MKKDLITCPYCKVAGFSQKAFLFHKTRCLKAPPDAWYTKPIEKMADPESKKPRAVSTPVVPTPIPVPVLALSVRQPWAWLIVKGYKDIENRTWNTMFFGRIWVHAGQGMTQREYDACALACAPLGVLLPRKEELLRGGIVGSVELVKCVGDTSPESKSPWFVGPWGFVLRDARECEFIECSGEVNFFQPNFGGQKK